MSRAVVDVENVFGLGTRVSLFRFGGYYRFNQKHHNKLI